MTPDKLVRPAVLGMSAYHVADAAGMVKLDAMENPYPLPEPLRRELAEVLSRVALNRYPEPNPPRLCELIRRKMAVPQGMEILLGNGSDELIQMLAMALAREGATMMYPAPTFVVYSLSASFTGMRVVPVPLRDDFSLDADAFIARMRKEKPALVFLAYPNNPTGVLYPQADVLRIIEAAPGVVVLDEAYHVFAGQTFMGALPKYRHLIVLRTVSKLGLAGIRLGYLAANPEWVRELNKVRPPYNINVLTEATATFMLQHLDVLEAQAAEIRAERAKLYAGLNALRGITVFPSAANFFLVRVPDAAKTYEALRGQGVLVRNLHPGIANCLRVTVGTPDENRILLNALKEAL